MRLDWNDSPGARAAGPALRAHLAHFERRSDLGYCWATLRNSRRPLCDNLGEKLFSSSAERTSKSNRFNHFRTPRSPRRSADRSAVPRISHTPPVPLYAQPEFAHRCRSGQTERHRGARRCAARRAEHHRPESARCVSPPLAKQHGRSDPNHRDSPMAVCSATRTYSAAHRVTNRFHHRSSFRS